MERDGTQASRRTRRALALTLGILALVATLAGAQETFRVTWEVDRTNPGRTGLKGRVFNDARVDVVDVYVTAEAVDGAGKVVARGISFVAPTIPPRSSAPFEAAVPAPAGATTFRVRVSAFRFSGMQQTP